MISRSIKSNFKNFRWGSSLILNEAMNIYKDKCLSGETPNDIMDIIHTTFNKAEYTLEIIRGRLMQYGRASLKHNITTSYLNGLFYNFCKEKKNGYVVFQDCTIDYHTDPKTELTHDIVLLKCKPSECSQFLISGSTMRLDSRILPVVVIVEVLSPDSGKKDRKEARQLCEKQKYPYYWLIDPLKKTIEIYEYNSSIEKYNLPLKTTYDDNNDCILQSKLDLKIKLTDIFPYI